MDAADARAGEKQPHAESTQRRHHQRVYER